MNAVAEHGRGKAGLRRAVGNHDRRRSRVQAPSPCRNGCVKRVDWIVVVGQGDDFVDLTLSERTRPEFKHCTHDNAHVSVRVAQLANYLSIGRDNLAGAGPGVHVVGSEHKVDDIGLGRHQPVDEIVVCDIDAAPARMALMAKVKSRVFGLAVLRISRLRPDKSDFVDEAGLIDLIIDEGSPAGDLRNGVAQIHCEG